MGKEKTLINNMTEGSVFKQLIKFAIPLILANLLQSLYNSVDMIVVGQFVGSGELSAVSVGGELLHLFTNFSLGFSMGSQILIAQHVGADDRDGVKKCIGTTFTVVVGLSLVLMVVGILVHKALPGMLNTPEEAYAQTQSYLLICCAGLPFIFGYNCVSSILRGMGDSKRPLLFIAIAAVINIILDLVLVGIFGMGAAGAAFATIFSQGISVAISVIYLYRNRAAFYFDFKLNSFRVDKIKLNALLKVSIPLAVQSTAINISMLFITSSINAYGIIATAVNGVGNRIQNFCNVIIMGISGAGGTMIGQNLGAGKLDRSKRVVYIALVISAVFFVLNTMLALLFPEQLFSLFNTEPEVLDMAVWYMRIQIWAFFGASLMSTFGTMVTGSGFAALGLVIGLLDGVVARIGLSVLLAEVFGMGLAGYFYGNAFARLAGAAVQMTYFFSGKWKTRRLLVDRKAEPLPDAETAPDI